MTTSARVRTLRSRGRRRATRTVGAFAAVGLAVSGLAAQPAQAADTGVLTGKVFTQTIGGAKTAASDVYIYLSYSATLNGNYDSIDSNPATPQTNGYAFDGSTFSFANLKAGFYKFEVAGVADVGDVEFQREYYNDADSLGGATPVQVGTGTTTTADMILEPAGQITGTVTDRAGNPLRNASISFQDSDRGGTGYATTDAAGTFTSEKDPADGFGSGLVRGDYRVSARLDDYTNPDAPSYEERYWPTSSTYAGAAAVTVVPGQTKGGINIVLDVAPRVRLTVKDPAGQVVPDNNVGIYVPLDGGGWGPYQAGPNTTDASGVFRKTMRIGDRYKFFVTPKAGVGGVTEWYDNAYSEATATEIVATTYGQVADITIQLGSAPVVTPSPTPAPAPSRFKTSKVSISGTAKVGKKLRAKTRSWAPAPVAMSYTWYRNGKVIKGQKRSTYTLRKADQGKRITVRVHQRKASYVTANRLSTKTAKVKKR